MKVGDKVILLPKQHEEWRNINGNWDFEGPAIAIVKEIRPEYVFVIFPKYGTKYNKYENSSTHSFIKERAYQLLIPEEIYNSPLYKALKEE